MMIKNGIQDNCSFTGKERDSETGYGYFGARYMDHEVMTMWLSIDPMAVKYPGISPYPDPADVRAVPLVWICNPDPLSIRICNPQKQCTEPR